MRALPILGTILMFASPAASQQSACTAVYENAVRSVSRDVRSLSERASFFRLHCERDGSARSSSVGAGLNVPGYADGSYSNAQRSQHLREFCRRGASDRLFEASSSIETDMVSEAALQSFNQCRVLERNNLVISYSETHPTGVTIDGRFTVGGLSVELDSFAAEPAESITCTSTSFSPDGTAEVIDGSRRYRIGNEGFSISCARTPIREGGSTYYQRAVVRLSTTIAPFSITLAGDSVLGYDLASHAEHVAGELRANLGEARAALARSERAAQRREEALTTAISGASATPHMAIFGSADVCAARSYPPSFCTAVICQPGQQANATTRAAARAVCRAEEGRMVNFTRFNQHAGGSCGFTYFTFSCLHIDR